MLFSGERRATLYKMVGLRLMPSLTVALIILFLATMQFKTAESGPIAGAACEAACVTVFIACISAALPAVPACFAACQACTQGCAAVFLLPTP